MIAKMLERIPYIHFHVFVLTPFWKKCVNNNNSLSLDNQCSVMQANIIIWNSPQQYVNEDDKTRHQRKQYKILFCFYGGSGNYIKNYSLKEIMCRDQKKQITKKKNPGDFNKNLGSPELSGTDNRSNNILMFGFSIVQVSHQSNISFICINFIKDFFFKEGFPLAIPTQFQKTN